MSTLTASASLSSVRAFLAEELTEKLQGSQHRVKLKKSVHKEQDLKNIHKEQN